LNRLSSVVLAAGLCLAAGGVVWPAEDNSACMTCHGTPGMGASIVEEKSFLKSAHRDLACIACHSDAAEMPHPEKLQAVSCSLCHASEVKAYRTSDHGRSVARGRADAKACQDCHGPIHEILSSENEQSPVHRKNIPTTCASCHEDLARMSKTRLTEPHPVASYNHTVHAEAFAAGNAGSAVCSDCHGAHDLNSSANPLSRVHRNRIPQTCGACHETETAVFNRSIHGKAHEAGIKESPVCTDCHGEHTIRSPKEAGSRANVGAVTKTCSGCHESERMNMKFGLPDGRLSTYLDSYHGLAFRRGDRAVANCASCHGYHDVLPASDPKSMIHKDNLATTCGSCHPGAGPLLSRGRVHGGPSDSHWTITLVKLFYWILIPLIIGFMLLHNLLDLFRKMLSAPTTPKPEEFKVTRLTRSERWQHGILAITFVGLAITGFALKFPEADWARLLSPFSEVVRRAIHRWLALAFCLLGVYHIGHLLLTQRGREVLRAFTPRWADVQALGQHLAWTLGWRKSPPESHGHYHYAEKLEYWSLIWGSIVMVITGGLLVFNNFTLKHFPLWVSELATLVHYYEAVLACLAIVVWHLYLVIFDPHIYPMNWAWLIGTIRRKLRL